MAESSDDYLIIDDLKTIKILRGIKIGFIQFLKSLNALMVTGRNILGLIIPRFGVIGSLSSLAFWPVLAKSSDDYLRHFLILVRSHRMTINPCGICQNVLAESSDDYLILDDLKTIKILRGIKIGFIQFLNGYRAKHTWIDNSPILHPVPGLRRSPMINVIRIS